MTQDAIQVSALMPIPTPVPVPTPVPIPYGGFTVRTFVAHGPDAVKEAGGVQDSLRIRRGEHPCKEHTRVEL